jgi:CheY-specific phosphatase CheX
MFNSDMTALDEILTRALRLALGGIHEAYVAQDPGPQESRCDVAALVKFRGPVMRGSLVLMTASAEAAKTLRPPPPVSELLVRDWVGELANQILGRIKNRLLEHGLSFDPGMPRVVWGPDLERAVHSDPGDDVLVFEASNVPLTVRFAVTVDETADVAAMAPQETAAEGDVILFGD